MRNEGRDRLGRRALRDRLTRRTSGGRLIPEIDGLRFIAIAMVLALHVDDYTRDREKFRAASWLHNLVQRGDTGVLLFFAISGFILGLGFARAAAGTTGAVSIARYLKRRVTRLEPPYIAAMTILLIAYVVIRHQSLSDLLPHHLASLGYVHNLVYGDWSPVNAVAWSLEVEVQFYLLAPVLALAYRLPQAWHRRGVFAGIGLAAALAQLGPLEGAGWPVQLSLAGHLQHFMAGMIVADLVARRPVTPALDSDTVAPRRATWMDVAGVCGFLLIIASARDTTARALLIPLGSGCCLLAALYGRRVRALLARPWIYIVGGMCYSIYLLHDGVISLLGPITTRVRLGGAYLPNLALQMAVLGLASVIIAAVFFVAVERPCMDPDWPARLLAAVRQRGREPKRTSVGR